MDYEDFSLRIDPVGDGFQVVVSSPAGEWRDTFLPPFGEVEIGPVRQVMTRDVGLGSDMRDLIRPPAGRVRSPQEIGSELFEALFAGEVRRLFDRSLGMVSVPPRRGLRIRLHLEPSSIALRSLCTLPWELLREGHGDFLGLNRFTPIVRYLEVNQPIVPLPKSTTLRVLILFADPLKRTLDLEGEKLRIESAFRSQVGVSIEAFPATRKNLDEKLRIVQPHILHFMGHGFVDSGTGQGSLLFYSDEGLKEPVSGSQLAASLQLPLSPALVVLNACSTAVSVLEQNPFAGVAAGLVKQGLLAVVAMQDPISDTAALTFSETLYGHLAAADPVDAAVTEARRALHRKYPDRWEWGTPVLFMRTPDGNLFDPSLVPIEEKEAVKRFVDSLSEGHQRAVLREFDPPTQAEDRRPDTTTRMKKLTDLMARRGEDDWVRLMESILAVRSPVSLLDGTPSGWVSRPNDAWDVNDGALPRWGGDPASVLTGPPDLARCFVLSWEGLRFRNGCLTVQIESRFLLHQGGAVGLSLCHTSRLALLGLIRCSPRAGAYIEIWKVEGSRLLDLGSLPLLGPDSGVYDLSFQLEKRCAALRCGETLLEIRLAKELPPGHAGLVRFNDTFARFSHLRLTVQAI